MIKIRSMSIISAIYGVSFLLSAPAQAIDITNSVSTVSSGDYYDYFSIDHTVNNMTGGFINIMSNGELVEMQGGTVAVMVDKAVIDSMFGTAAIAQMDSGYIKDFYGNANIDLMTGGTILNINDSATIFELGVTAIVKNMSGGKIAWMHGGAKINSLTGGLINRLADTANISSMSGTAHILTMLGSSTIDSLSGAAQIDAMSGSALIRNMSGGTIVSMSNGTITSMSGGTVGSMSGGKIGSMSGGTINELLAAAQVVFTGDQTASSGSTITGNVSNTTNLTLAQNGYVSLNSTINLFDGTLKMQGGTANIVSGVLGSSHLFDMQMGTNTLLLDSISDLNIKIAADRIGNLDVSGVSRLQNLASADNTAIINKTGSGRLLIDTDNSTRYTGITNIHNGSLVIGTTPLSSGALGGDVNVSSGATLGGYGSVMGSVNNSGTLAVGSAVDDLVADVTANFKVYGNVTNSGLITLGGNSAAGDTLLFRVIMLAKMVHWF